MSVKSEEGSFIADMDINSVTAFNVENAPYSEQVRFSIGGSAISSVGSVQDYFEVQDVPEEPPLSKSNLDMISAKAYLQKPSSVDGISLYDHLSDLLEKVIAERPKNVIDFFEDYSRKMREARFHPETDHLKDVYTSPWEYKKSLKLLPLFLAAELKPDLEAGDAGPNEDMPDGEDDTKRNDLLEMLFYFEQAGVGLPSNQMYCMELAIQQLARSKIISKVRFWGKIIGIEKNYLIAETELTEEEYTRRNTEAEELRERLAKEAEELAAAQKEAEELAAAEQREAEEQAALAKAEQEAIEAQEKEAAEEAKRQELEVWKQEMEARKQEALANGEEWVDEIIEEPEPEVPVEPPVPIKPFPEYPLPKSAFVPPTDTLPELSGEGINKKVYFVCYAPGDEWIMLPDLTPKQIVVSRQIKKYFTGDLEAPVDSFPVFPGVEMNYLRAQIARITAGTHISPLGFYSFGGGEEEEEEMGEEEDEDAGQKEFSPNPNFEVLPLRDLIDPSMNYWVHHSPYILPQGRIKWWNPAGKGKEMDEEMEEAEEEEEGAEAGPEKEVGPPLLTPLSEDATLESIPPWSVRSSSALVRSSAIGVVRSNLWPGATTFAVGKKFENIYIGLGLKYNARNYTPPGMEAIQLEYLIGPEILETIDPTVEEEEAWRIAHLPKPKPEKGAEDEEIAEEEEEEEEEDEDDD